MVEINPTEVQVAKIIVMEAILVDMAMEEMAAMEEMVATEAMVEINPTEVQVAKIIVMEAILVDMAMVVMEDIALTTMMEIKLQLMESQNKSMTGGITSEKISSMVWFLPIVKTLVGKLNSKKNIQST